MTDQIEDGVKPVAWMIPDWGVVYGPDGYRYLTSEQTKTNRADWEDGEYDKFQESMKGAVPLYAHPALQAPVVVSDDWLRDTAMNAMLATEVEEAVRILKADYDRLLATQNGIVNQHLAALAQSAAENREIAMQGLAAEGQAQEAYEKLTAARAEIERLTRERDIARSDAADNFLAIQYSPTNYELADAEARAKAAEAALRKIKPYLDWTVSDESPSYHPTMPSAVAEFNAFLSTLPASTAPAGEVVTDAMVERALGAWWDADPGPTDTSYREAMRAAITAAITEGK